jgi:hypothetical protein
LAAALCCAAAKNYCCVAPWRAHQTLLSPATRYALCRDARTRSNGTSIRRRLSRHRCGALTSRQLDHSRMLAWPQPRDKHGPAVRKFQRIMMGIRVAQVDLPEPGHVGPELASAWQQAAEDMVVFGFPIENHLGARQHADRDLRLPDGGKAARRDQLVGDLGGAGCGGVQTIVTH